MTNVVKLPATRTGKMQRNKETIEFLYNVRMEVYEWDIEDLMSETGLSRATIYSFRNGRTKFPRPGTLFAILDALGWELVLIRKQTNEVVHVRS